MKRRDFIVASGSTVLSGLVASGIQRPAVGLDFEISTPDKDPSKVDSLVIEFETLEITPRYLDEKEPVSVQAKVEVANQTKRSNELQTSVINGRTKNLENSIDSIVVDGLNTSSSISGDVTVSIDHSDIRDSYSQQFYVNGSEIPDSAIHRWKLDDVETGIATDSIGSEDGAVNGVVSVSGTYQGGSAGEGDGTDDNINIGIETFGSSTDTDFAVGSTVDNLSSSADGSVMGVNDTNSRIFEIATGAFNDGGVYVTLRDTNVNLLRLRTDTGGYINDGNKHRILWNKSTNDVSNWKIYIDGSAVSTTVVSNDSGFSGGDFATGVFLFATTTGNTRNNLLSGVVDDHIIYDSLLSSSEISDDYNAQPWS